MIDACLAWVGGGGMKVGQGFRERQRERNLMCVQRPTTCHRRTSYLPAVRMLQRLRHTAAIVLPLGQAHSSIILLLSPVWTGLTVGHQGSVNVLDWCFLCPTATASTTSFPAYIVPSAVGTFCCVLQSVSDKFSVSLYNFPLFFSSQIFQFVIMSDLFLTCCIYPLFNSSNMYLILEQL